MNIWRNTKTYINPRIKGEKKSDRITWIDSMRGIGLCGVVLIHVGGKDLPYLAERVVAAGKYGVQLLFLLSGYLAFYSYKKQFKDYTEIGIVDNIRWLWKRVIRLIPLYVIALLIYLAVLIILDGNTTEAGINAKNIIFHIFFVQGVSPHYINSIIPGGWYLGTLVLGYCLIPFFFRVCNTIENTIYAFVVSAFMCCYISNCFMHWFSNGIDSGVYSDYFGRLWIITQIPVLIIGVLLYNILSSGILDKIRKKLLFSAVFLTAAAILLFGLIIEVNHIKGISNITLWGVAFFIICISQILVRGFAFDNKLFGFIGSHSYPIYLFHPLMIRIVDFVLRRFHVSGITWMILRYLLVLGLSCGISIPFVALESRIRKRIKK